ncbi:hypothetical protein H4S08_004901 [Coemansia sp. RSA 1365]|nr:hypothetical protein H4S08_004901 [Coemansia sp. RSA 1365]
MALAATTEWDFHLPLVQLAMNMHLHRAIGIMPAQKMFGRIARSALSLLGQPSELSDKLSVTMLSDFCDRIVHPTVARHLSEYQACMKKSLDGNRPQAEFKIGDVVHALDLIRRSRNAPKWLWPFQVAAISRGGAILLAPHGGDDASILPERNCAAHQLVQFEEAPKPPIEHYEVDRILVHRRNSKVMQFKVHWHRFPSREDTWESTSAFPDPELLANYASTLSSLCTANADRKAVGMPPQRARDLQPRHG